MLAASFLGLPAVASILVAGWIFVVFGLTQLSILIALLLCFIACGLIMVLKLVLHRPRPLTDYAKRMRFQTYSFPSGHSFSAAVLYGFAAHLISLYALTSWAAWTTLALYGLILLVGISRIYLGAHYLLDVLAGWALGIVILWAIVTVVPV
jgi:membrane-associated phospholipid phosphatase